MNNDEIVWKNLNGLDLSGPGAGQRRAGPYGGHKREREARVGRTGTYPSIEDEGLERSHVDNCPPVTNPHDGDLLWRGGAAGDLAAGGVRPCLDARKVRGDLVLRLRPPGALHGRPHGWDKGARRRSAVGGRS
jgi:hypothetical protein